jgi:hypothetical protein
LEDRIGQALDEVDRQIEGLRQGRAGRPTARSFAHRIATIFGS